MRIYNSANILNFLDPLHTNNNQWNITNLFYGTIRKTLNFQFCIHIEYQTYLNLNFLLITIQRQPNYQRPDLRNASLPDFTQPQINLQKSQMKKKNSYFFEKDYLHRINSKHY